MKNNQLRPCLDEAIGLLETAGIDGASQDARFLLLEIADRSLTDLVSQPELVLSNEILVQFQTAIQDRINGKPIGRILGQTEFYGRLFKVTDSVLDPRADTEILVGAALDALSNNSEPVNILDLGTGSGAIICTLLCERSKANGTGIDISDDALKVAGENAITLGIEDRLDLKLGSYYRPLRDNAFSTFDLIVSNPPYISTQIIDDLAIEVRNHDPHLALDGGEDGLDAYRDIIANAPDFLTAHGYLILEIGFDQAAPVRELIEINSQLKYLTCKTDLSGADRVIVAQRSI